MRALFPSGFAVCLILALAACTLDQPETPVPHMDLTIAGTTTSLKHGPASGIAIPESDTPFVGLGVDGTLYLYASLENVGYKAGNYCLLTITSGTTSSYSGSYTADGGEFSAFMALNADEYHLSAGTITLDSPLVIGSASDGSCVTGSFSGSVWTTAPSTLLTLTGTFRLKYFYSVDPSGS